MDKLYKNILKEQRFPNGPRNDGQTNPVMIPSGSTLNQVVDVTFATDADVALKETIATVTALSASLAENVNLKATIVSLTALSASFEARLTALEP